MTDSLLDELDRLAEKATKGEWFWDGINYIFSAKDGDSQMICEMRGVGAKLPIEDNADFIVTLVNAWPEIKDEITRLNVLVEEVSREAKRNAEMHDEVVVKNAILKSNLEYLQKANKQLKTELEIADQRWMDEKRRADSHDL